MRCEHGTLVSSCEICFPKAYKKQRMESSASPTYSAAENATTDEWSDQHPLFRDNVDSAIKRLTALRGDDAYKLRRMVMIFARQEFEGR